ncbi:lysosomal acid glucosylceramidase isoform X2 [Ischnura elegans]|uniref:lysosomal acid glucosylceramidase isoform X2 n=1 Tax=Ischnura elegans TaxID=197161 RepID=UPI001ED871E8|nr:lysosomal acid glucosylceramidase isoform X2 [Ischnura elegans]
MVIRCLRICILLLLFCNVKGSDSCVHKDYGNGGTVCVCNSQFCDEVGPIPPLESAKYILYSSSKIGDRLTRTGGEFNRNNYSRNRIRIAVDRKCAYQTILGFGGAFTDSAGINIMSLSDSVQNLLIRSYFSQDGIEYGMGRVPIGGSDFSTHTYTYDDVAGDVMLSHFNLSEEDFNYKIPLIKMAMRMSQKEIKLIGTAWTAPPWMKTNNDFSGFGFLKYEFFQVWADYMIRFLNEYKENGLKFWGITTGNEPINGIIPINRFNSMGWTPRDQREWISKNLGPSMAASQHNNTKLILLDDQRFMLPWWVNIVMSDANAERYIDGIGVHWYWDNLVPASALDATHYAHPKKFILATEASIGDKPWDFQKVLLGSWSRGEQYMKDIVEDLQHWVVGWIDWNLALNPRGGPNWAKNYVDSPIIVNATGDEFYKQPMFYAIGHFSKFIPEGSVRIGLNITEGEHYLNGVAFQRPDGGITVVIYNPKDSSAAVSITDDRYGDVNLEFQPRSFHTLVYM